MDVSLYFRKPDFYVLSLMCILVALWLYNFATKTLNHKECNKKKYKLFKIN